MTKIKIDSNLYDRLCKVAKQAGYPGPDEFITHVLEKELAVLEAADNDAAVTERLKGLGYLE